MAPNSTMNLRGARTWPVVVGAVCMGLTIFFLMGLILLSVAGHSIPCSSRFLVAAVLALTVGIGSSFLGGSAAARGQIPWKGVQKHPLTFAVTGGVAVVVITLVLGAQLYDGGPDCIDLPAIAAKPVVRGRVISAGGAPVGAARISVTGVGADSTGADGLFEVPVNGRSMTGRFSVSVYAAGYAALSKTFELDRHDVELGDLVLSRAE
jgi:hypothetical protein